MIATELASSMADLGVRVTIIEAADDILLTEINETREMLKAHLDNQGIKILTKAKIKQVKESKIILDGQDDVSFDTLLVATGRQPNTQVAKDLNLEMDGKFLKSMNIMKRVKTCLCYRDLIKGYQLRMAFMLSKQ